MGSLQVHDDLTSNFGLVAHCKPKGPNLNSNPNRDLRVPLQECRVKGELCPRNLGPLAGSQGSLKTQPHQIWGSTKNPNLNSNFNTNPKLHTRT